MSPVRSLDPVLEPSLKNWPVNWRRARLIAVLFENLEIDSPTTAGVEQTGGWPHLELVEQGQHQVGTCLPPRMPRHRLPQIGQEILGHPFVGTAS